MSESDKRHCECGLLGAKRTFLMHFASDGIMAASLLVGAKEEPLVDEGYLLRNAMIFECVCGKSFFLYSWVSQCVWWLMGRKCSKLNWSLCSSGRVIGWNFGKLHTKNVIAAN